MQLKKAERKKVKLKMAISSPSGGGKTYSSLLLAKGLVGKWDKIAIIDTENGSADLYSHLGPYMTLTLAPPFTPERYIEAIEVCEKAGMECIIIDSMSHEWAAEGGALDAQTKAGGRYQDWAKVTPRHDKFVSAMLHSPAHIIGTMRRKADYEITKEGNKTTVQKVGLKEVQREGIEYEFTLHLALNLTHMANAEKDRTGLFMGKPEFMITEETGKLLAKWADEGIDPTVYPDSPSNDEITVFLKFLKDQGVGEKHWSEIEKSMRGKPKKEVLPLIERVKNLQGA
jgi:hypothetical protein